MAIIETKKITKYFEGVHAVDHLSLTFEEGKITSLIGPNGSGKSTFINLLTGVFPITEGTLVIGGEKLEQLKSYRVSKYGVTRTFQDVRLFEQMPVIDNILVVLTERRVFASLFEKHKDHHTASAEEVLKEVGLWEKRNELAANLSYGQRKLLEIGRILAMDKRTDGRVSIVLFDEPYAGLFPEMRKVVTCIMRKLRDEGKAIIFVEHSMDLIRELSDYVYVLDEGKLLAQGSAEEVLSKREVIEAYLGD